MIGPWWGGAALLRWCDADVDRDRGDGVAHGGDSPRGPEVLSEWAERYGAGPDWHFLTGDHEAILTLAREGFLLGVDTAPTDGSAGPDPIIHSNRFALVDSEAKIRGYYDPFDPESVEKLLVDVRSLVQSTPNP